jgi:hypothetical protein
MIFPTARAAKRDIVGRLLVAGIPSLQGRVIQARVWPLKLTDLPALLVYGWQETKIRKTLDVWTHQFEVTCSMAIEGRVQGLDGPGVEADLETLAGAIEETILTAPELLGLNGSIERIDRVETKLEAHATAETIQGALSMSFDLVWTEIQQVAVPAGEQTDDFGILSTPTIF